MLFSLYTMVDRAESATHKDSERGHSSKEWRVLHGASGFWWEMTTLSLTRAQSELRWVMGVSGSVYKGV